MTLIWRIVLLILIPFQVFAQTGANPIGGVTSMGGATAIGGGGTMNLTPPSTDVSLAFLNNLFGVVDGVLHGTGSQMMGNIFMVFNSAVLALGGIIIMYTLIVSTMNTAQEGQFLGQKFSSIWVPVRSTMGLALLLPKASGYCMMQIFVMWVIVQGVGAADIVWNSALEYLNRGGVIIQAQMNTSQQLAAQSNFDVPKGATAILEGQVCMIALENQLKKVKNNLETLKANKAGGCYNNDPNFTAICNEAIPDLVGMTSPLAFQKDNPVASQLNMPMPYFGAQSTNPFKPLLQGACGTVSWNNSQNTNVGNINTLTTSDQDLIALNRAMAVQQLYQDMSAVAQIMVNNTPSLAAVNLATNGQPSPQFGIASQNPMCASQTYSSQSGVSCGAWVADTTLPSNLFSSSLLFSGMEIWNAVSDYEGVMQPTLNLAIAAQNSQVANQERAFILKSEQDGWIMAGSYFWNVIALNGNAGTGQNNLDMDSGLSASTGVINDGSGLLSAFKNNGCDATNTFGPACQWLTSLNPNFDTDLRVLINNNQSATTNSPYSLSELPSKATTGDASNSVGSVSVWGFVNNALMMKTGNQPGFNPVSFANNFSPSVGVSTNFSLSSFSCTGFLCIPSTVGNIFIALIGEIIDAVVNMILSAINQLLLTLIIIPLRQIAQVFAQGITVISTPGVNPIVAMANMGNLYISFASNMMMGGAVAAAVVAAFAPTVLAVIMIFSPIIVSWFVFMMSIGFMTAYYVPIIPYMIFTFGALAWFMLVIEAIVAAPIVALGVTHPEGHDAFGKSEQALNLLIGIFLRPSLMIIGYISGIALSFVGVWMLNAGFDNAVTFLTNTSGGSSTSPNVIQPYIGWTGVYAYQFSIMIYISIYMTIIQKSYSLIVLVPDRVMRWIGSQESAGSESLSWGEEIKGKTEQLGRAAGEGMQQAGKGMIDMGMQQGKDSQKEKADQAKEAKQEEKQAQQEAKSDQKHQEMLGAIKGGKGGGGGGAA